MTQIAESNTDKTWLEMYTEENKESEGHFGGSVS